MVVQLVKDYEDYDEVNKQLERMYAWLCLPSRAQNRELIYDDDVGIIAWI
jgi:hypothetical protein